MTMRLLAILAFLLLAVSPTLRAAATVDDIRCSPASGTYGVGDTVSIAVTFSAAVNVTALNSKLRLSVGRAGNNAFAVPTDASSVTTAIFVYTVATDDVSTDLDYTDTGALIGVTGYSGILTAPGLSGSLSQTSSVVIDGVIPTVALSNPGTSRTAPVNVNITASKPLSGLVGSDFTITPGTGIVSGTTLAVTPGSPVTAAATANAGATTIQLKRAVSGILLAEGAPISIGSSLYQLEDAADILTSATSVKLTRGLDVALASGTSVFVATGADVAVTLPADARQDAAGNGNAVSNTVTFSYDPTPPFATITAPTSAADPFVFKIDFSEVVVDALTAGDLQITNGTVAAIDGTGNPNFLVTVTPTVANTAVTLNLLGGSVHDAANNGNLTASASFQPVAVQSVTATPASGTYRIGDMVTITVLLNKDVTYTHSAAPTLRLNTGGAGRNITCIAPTAGPATVRQLTFTYTVADGDASPDLDYLATTSLDLLGSTLDSLTTLALPTPGAAGSLAANAALVIDGNKPAITIVDPQDFYNSTPVTLTFSTNEAVTGLAAGDFIVTGATAAAPIGSGTNYTVALSSPTSALTFASGASAGASNVSLAATQSISLAAGAPLRIGSSLYQLAAAANITATPSTVALKSSLLASVGSGTPVFTATGVSIAAVVAADACEDAAGNGNARSNEVTFSYDPTPPVATITAPASSATPFVFTIDFSEAVVDALTNGDLQVVNGAIASIDGTGNPHFEVTVTPTSATSDVTLTLAANSVHDAASNGNPIASASFEPLVVEDVTSTTASGTYRIGDVVTLTVLLNKDVTYTHGAAPTLRLNTGGAGRDATCTAPTAGPATVRQLTFTYTVADGDASPDLDYIATTSLNLHGSTLDGLTTLALPAPGAAGSLAANAALVIDGKKPTITIADPQNFYNSTPITFSVSASEIVTGLTADDFIVTGATSQLTGSGSSYSLALRPTSTLALAANASAGAMSVSLRAVPSTTLMTGAPLRIGSGLYQVAIEAPVTATATPVTLTRGLDTTAANGTPVFTATPSSVSLELPAGICTDEALNGNVAANDIAFIFDPVPPLATITPPASAAASLVFTVDFSESAVDTLLASELSVVGGTISSINGAGNPHVEVTVIPTVIGGEVTLNVLADAVRDAAGNGNPIATGAFRPLAVQAVTTTPVAATYVPGGTITIVVAFNKDVAYVPGTEAPTLLLDLGETGQAATCITPASGATPLRELTFTYQVRAGDETSALDYLSPTALDLDGGTLDTLTHLSLPAPGALGSLSANSDIVVDGARPVATIADPGEYVVVAPVDLLITFSEPVTRLLTGDFVLTGATGVLRGSGDTYALSLEPTSALTFATAASAGAVIVNLKSVSSTTLTAGTPLLIGNTVYRVKADTPVNTTLAEVELTTGLASSVAIGTRVFGPTGTQVAYELEADVCQDVAGNGNTAVAQASFIYDPTPPVASIDLDTTSTDAAFNVVFSETAASNLTAADIITDNCTVVSIVSAGNPTFKVTVAVTDLTANFSIGLAEGAVIDAAGNESLAVDPQIFVYFPYPLKVSAVNADGTYGEGDRLRIRVTFNEPVFVTGTPTLVLAMDAGTRIATYTEGSETEELLFDYTIVKGDAAADLDYASVNALQLNGGTIRDADGNDATRTFDVPGSTGSLSDNADLKIDAGVPDGKPDAGDLPDDSSGGCGAGTGIAVLLSLGWLTAAGFNRRKRR